MTKGTGKKGSQTAASAEPVSDKMVDPRPESAVTLESIHNSISAIHVKLDSQTAAQEKLQTTLGNNTLEIEQLQTECMHLKEKNTSLVNEVSLLKSIVAKQSYDIDVLKRERKRKSQINAK